MKHEDIQAHVDAIDFEALAMTPAAVRIAWQVAGMIGHGDWFILADEDTLAAAVRALNSDYGPGTHWLEYRDCRDDD